MNRLSIVPLLQELGLQHDEAIVYLELINNGPSEVGKISKFCEFSRTKIYIMIDKLLAKNWITTISDKPKKFAAVDPEEILGHRKEKILNACDTALAELKPMYESTKFDISETINYRGHSAFLKIEEMISSAKEEIFIISTVVKGDDSGNILKGLKKARKRGVKIKALFSETFKQTLSSKESINTIDMSFGKIPNGGLVIIDDREILFGGLDSDEKEFKLDNVLAIWTKNRAIIRMTKMVFKQFYNEQQSSS